MGPCKGRQQTPRTAIGINGVVELPATFEFDPFVVEINAIGPGFADLLIKLRFDQNVPTWILVQIQVRAARECDQVTSIEFDGFGIVSDGIVELSKGGKGI